MTNEEAIKWIKDHHCPDDWACDCNDTAAMRLAIDALKKQIPKKPYHDDAVGVPNGCPCCDTLVNIGEDFCPSCGQAIDWSEDI